MPTPFTAKCGQRPISTKFPNFIFYNFDKQIASCESTDRELSFEWSHHRISSAGSKVGVALQNSSKYSGSEGVTLSHDHGNPIRYNVIEIKYTFTLKRSADEMDCYSGAVPKPAIKDIMVHGRETASGSGTTEPTR